MEQIRKVEYGLRHANGYVRQFDNLYDALAVKLGKKFIGGRRGEWANHEVVSREVVTAYSDWTKHD